VGVGTWSHLQRTSLAAFDHVNVDVAILLIATGAVMFVVSLFGCLGALRENRCLLKTVRNLRGCPEVNIQATKTE
jgi:hypothetical protein